MGLLPGLLVLPLLLIAVVLALLVLLLLFALLVLLLLLLLLLLILLWMGALGLSFGIWPFLRCLRLLFLALWVFSFLALYPRPAAFALLPVARVETVIHAIRPLMLAMARSGCGRRFRGVIFLRGIRGSSGRPVVPVIILERLGLPRGIRMVIHPFRVIIILLVVVILVLLLLIVIIIIIIMSAFIRLLLVLYRLRCLVLHGQGCNFIGIAVIGGLASIEDLGDKVLLFEGLEFLEPQVLGYFPQFGQLECLKCGSLGHV